MRAIRSVKMNTRLMVSRRRGEPNSLNSGPISPYLKSTVFQMRKKNQNTIEKCRTSCRLSVARGIFFISVRARAYMVSASDANCWLLFFIVF